MHLLCGVLYKYLKNTIRDGEVTLRYTLLSLSTLFTLLTWFTLLIWFALFTWFTMLTLFYTVDIVFHYSHSLHC